MNAIGLFALLTFLQPSAGDRLEVLAEGAKAGSVFAIAMSPNGKYVLGSPSSITGSDYVYVIGMHEYREFSLPSTRNVVPVAALIDDLGGVIANCVVPVKIGTIQRSVRVQGDSVTPIPVPLGDPGSGQFEPIGVGPDNAIYGRYTEGPALDGAAAAWRGQRLDVIYTGHRMLTAVTRISNGIVGLVPRFKSPGLAHNWLPVIFRPNNQITPLPIPRNCTMGYVVGANRSGTVILGSTSSDHGLHQLTVWLDGESVVYPTPKGARLQDLKSVTASGDLAVGTRHSSRGTAAIVWESGVGLMTLAEYAKKKEIPLPEDWTPIDAIGIAPEGEFICGNAVDGKGKRRPYRLWLKERPKKDGL